MLNKEISTFDIQLLFTGINMVIKPGLITDQDVLAENKHFDT